MSTEPDLRARIPAWRRILFVVVTVLAANSIVALANALGPWLPEGPPIFGDLQYPETHLWHAAVPGTVRGLVETGVLVALLWRPWAKPLLAQWLALSLVLGLPVIVPFAGLPAFLFTGLPSLLVVAAYPWPGALFEISAPDRSRILLVLAATATVLLAPSLWREFLWQVGGVGVEHATAFHWAQDVQNLLKLLIAAWLSATKRPGWLPLALLTGGAFVYLGATAVAFPNQAGSWGVAGGIVALVGGAAFVTTALGEQNSRVRPEPSNTARKE